jgi:hypothetical protein
VFENRVLRRIFGPKCDEVTGKWKKLHNEELHNSYSSLNIRKIKLRRLRWAGQCVQVYEPFVYIYQDKFACNLLHLNTENVIFHF